MIRRVSVFALCFLAVVGCGGELPGEPSGDVVVNPTRTPSDVASTKFIKTFLLYYGDGSNLTVEEKTIFSKHNLLGINRFMHEGKTHNIWAAIRSSNPNIEIYLYESASETSNFHDQYEQLYLNDLGRYDVSRGHSLGGLNSQNPELYLLDSAGNQLFNLAYSDPTNNQYWYLMDFGNPKYHAYWLESVYTDIIAQPWRADGIFADLCTAVNWGAYGKSTTKYSTNQSWMNAMNSFVNAITAGVHHHNQKLWCNRGETWKIDGYNAWLSLDQSTSAPDIVLEEGAFAVSWGIINGTQFYPEEDWKRQVDVLASVNNSRIAFLSHAGLTERQTGLDNYGKPVTFWQTLWYSLSSFLLGRNDIRDNAYFSFSVATGYDKIVWFDEFDYINIGKAIGSYHVSSYNGANIYWREFERGYVYVNPGLNDVQSISLPQPGRQLKHDNFKNPPETIPVTDNVNLNAHNGTIILKI